MPMVRDGVEQRLLVIAFCIKVPVQRREPVDEAFEIVRAHASIGVEQRAKVAASFFAHGRFLEETLDALVIPDLVDDFLFVRSHVSAVFFLIPVTEFDDSAHDINTHASTGCRLAYRHNRLKKMDICEGHQSWLHSSPEFMEKFVSTPASVPFREIGLVGLAAAAVYTLLAIVSYSPMDPSFTYSGNGADVQNLVGRSGAWFADLMLYLFGVMAYAVPVALVVIGLRLVRRALEPVSWTLVSVRGLGWVSLLICGCVLAQVHFVTNEGLPAGQGGVLGQWLVEVGEPVFGWVGLTLLCLTGMLIGAQAAAGFSWMDVSEVTGRWLHTMTRSVVSFIDRRMDVWRARKTAKVVARDNAALRKTARKKLAKKEAAREQPKIATWRNRKPRPPATETL